MQLIQKVIKEELKVSPGDLPLAFLKYSTASSGKNLKDKVIFFVFKPKEKTPFLCVKTVRSHTSGEVVRQNFHNLKKLNELTAGSSYQDFFAKAIHLYDDGENIFSLESVCPGKRVRLDERLLGAVVSRYTGFQEHISKRSNQSVSDLQGFKASLVNNSSLSEADQAEILLFTNSLTLPKTLPKLIQHGDLTEDNMLFEAGKFSVVDCDYLGVMDLPGFDLFSLFRRYSLKDAKKLCEQYLAEYFKRIGASVKKEDYLGLMFLYYFMEKTLRKPGLLRGVPGKKVIAEFTADFF